MLSLKGNLCLCRQQMQGRAIIRQLHPPIPGSRDHNLGHSCHGALSWPLVPVHPPTGEEHSEPEAHEEQRDREADSPTDIVLHPDQHGGRQQGADVDGEEVPVEEGTLPQALRGSEASNWSALKAEVQGLDATIAKGREIESKVDGNTADVVGGLQHRGQ
jgi:hypothetical protein